MTLDDEDAVKSVLGIRSFGQMSKRTMLRFAAAMPDMSDDVRIRLMQQIPGLQKFALDSVGIVESTFESTLDANKDSQRQSHEAFANVRDVLEGQLGRDGLSEAQQRHLVDKLVETAHDQSVKDSENKEFLANQASSNRKTILAITGMALVTTIVLAGAKVLVERSDDGENDNEAVGEPSSD